MLAGINVKTNNEYKVVLLADRRWVLLKQEVDT